MKSGTKLLMGIAMLVMLSGSVLAGTFYLQADIPTNPTYPGQSDYTR